MSEPRNDVLEATAVWLDMPEEFTAFMLDDGDGLHALHVNTMWDDDADSDGSSVVCLRSIGVAEVVRWHAKMGGMA